MAKGNILVEQAYAQGKMINHAGWNLVRGATPSDIDVLMLAENTTVIDNDGSLLAVEFSSQHRTWQALKAGQRRVYESLVRACRGQLRAALAYHQVPQDQQIKSKEDVLCFQLMYWDRDNQCVAYTAVMKKDQWIPTVEHFAGKS